MVLQADALHLAATAVMVQLALVLAALLVRVEGLARLALVLVAAWQEAMPRLRLMVVSVAKRPEALERRLLCDALPPHTAAQELRAILVPWLGPMVGWAAASKCLPTAKRYAKGCFRLVAYRAKALMRPT
jgi:hypothetical protein